MRICIVGCGAVGSLFAANLAQLDDVDVWAYDLDEAHVDAINAKGLRLSGQGEVVGRLRATADANAVPACDFGVVATKAMHSEAAIAATAHAFAEGCVATVQNGLGNEEALAPVHEGRSRALPRNRSLPASKEWPLQSGCRSMRLREPPRRRPTGEPLARGRAPTRVRWRRGTGSCRRGCR